MERLETRLPFSAGGGAPAALVVPDSFEIFASVADGDSELQTDEFIVGVQSSGESNEPSVACLADDSQIVVFLSGADGQQNVMARRLWHDHSGVEDSFVVQPLTTADGPFPLVAGVGVADGYVVVWATEQGISARRYDGFDNAVGSTISVASDTSVRRLFAVENEDGYSIVWESETTAGATQLTHSLFGHAGNTLVANQILMSGTAGGSAIYTDFQVFEHPTLAFAYSWAEFDIASAEMSALTIGEYDASEDSQTFVAVPVSDDWWSPPTLVAYSDSEYILAGQRFGEIGDETFVQLVDRSGNLLDDRVVHQSSGEFDSLVDVASLNDDGVVVVYYESLSDEVVATQYNASLEWLMTWSVNDTATLPIDLKVVNSNGDGFSVYRPGYTLNDDPGTIVERTFRLKSMDLMISIDDTLLPTDGYIDLEGVPEEAGLNRGVRQEEDDSIWRVAIDELQGLQVLSDEFIEPFTISLSLYSANAELLANFRAEVGSEDTDRFFADFSADLIEGLGSDDELTLSDTTDQFVGEWATDDLALITHVASGETLYLHAVENFTFEDGSISVEEFIATFDSEEDPGDDGESGDDPEDDPETDPGDGGGGQDDDSGDTTDDGSETDDSGEDSEGDGASGDGGGDGDSSDPSDDEDGDESGGETGGDQAGSGDEGDSQDDSTGDDSGEDSTAGDEPDNGDSDVGDSEDSSGDPPDDQGEDAGPGPASDPPSQDQIADVASAIAAVASDGVIATGSATMSGVSSSLMLGSAEVGGTAAVEAMPLVVSAPTSGAASATSSTLNELKNLAGAILNSLADEVAGATDGASEENVAAPTEADSAQSDSAVMDGAKKSVTIFDENRASEVLIVDRDQLPESGGASTPDEPAPANAAAIAATADAEMTRMVALIDKQFASDSADAAADAMSAVEEVFSDQEMVTGVAVVVASGASLAQVAWLLRGSVVLTKLLSSMPVWSTFDPLPILSGHDSINVVPQNDESLVDITQS